ncbi:hypothetical protein BN12_100017 [Nostocoides japonicum T1-X7]|uniref:Uncharacterized protein n=1 Tax=Nostocoides japonicum T1-X7 TaxID=1194083 RepID=A0A077LSM4_9MICO|nr:hypothetical protein BN12_100017 [Tetrasphaera japonica T1-X7]
MRCAGVNGGLTSKSNATPASGGVPASRWPNHVADDDAGGCASRTSGGPSALGMATAIGLVPKIGMLTPEAATFGREAVQAQGTGTDWLLTYTIGRERRRAGGARRPPRRPSCQYQGPICSMVIPAVRSCNTSR